jgi:hypothetical protein
VLNFRMGDHTDAMTEIVPLKLEEIIQFLIASWNNPDHGLRGQPPHPIGLFQYSPKLTA